MVAATLVLLCTEPYETSMFGKVPWLLTVPAIAIIGREVIYAANYLTYFIDQINLCVFWLMIFPLSLFIPFFLDFP